MKQNTTVTKCKKEHDKIQMEQNANTTKYKCNKIQMQQNTNGTKYKLNKMQKCLNKLS